MSTLFQEYRYSIYLVRVVVVVVVVVMSFFLKVFDVKNRSEKKTCLFALKKKSQGGKLLFSSLK